MKNLKLLTLLWIILFAGTLAGCGGNKGDNTDNTGDFIIEDTTGQNDAVIKYNDTIVDLITQCMKSEDLIRDIYNNDASTSDISNAINNLVNTCSDAGEKINKLGDREGDNSLKKGTLTLIEKEINYYISFSELLPYLEKDGLTEDEKTTYDSIRTKVESLDKELSEANKNLSTIQEEFSSNHGFKLEEETVE